MKIIKILIILCITTNLNAQSLESVLDNMPNTDKHTNYTDFDDMPLQTKPGSLLSSFSLNLSLPITYYNSNRAPKKLTFKPLANKIIIQKYDVNPKVKTVLIRTNLGFPASFSLLNFKKENNKYIPVAYLRVHDGEFGGDFGFSFINNKINIYSGGESTGLGTTYSVNDAGEFVLEFKQFFDEENLQGLFIYNGSKVTLDLEGIIDNLATTYHTKNGDEAVVLPLQEIFSTLNDFSLRKIITSRPCTFYGPISHAFYSALNSNKSAKHSNSNNKRSKDANRAPSAINNYQHYEIDKIISSIKNNIGTIKAGDKYYTEVTEFSLWLRNKIRLSLEKKYSRVSFKDCSAGSYCYGKYYYNLHYIKPCGTILYVNRTNNTFNSMGIDDFIPYLAAFHEGFLPGDVAQKTSSSSSSSNIGKATVKNMYDIFAELDDATIEQLIYFFPNNSKINNLLNQNVPNSSSPLYTKSVNINHIRKSIGKLDDTYSDYYDAISPFEVWLEGKIEKYLLDKGFKTVEFEID